jgi:iron-sulfur cluster assembly protein
MFEVSEEASERISQFLKEKEGLQSIRILMTEGGWKGPSLVMALDEKKPDDEVIIDRGVTFLVNKPLFEKVKPIRIGYTHSTLGLGYTIDSELKKLAEHLMSECPDIYNNCKDIPR